MITQAQAPIMDRAQILVFGNEKGGCGKSTAAMHVIVGLLRQGYAVGSIDLDSRQGTLTRYFERRQHRAEILMQEGNRADLPLPEHIAIPRADDDNRDEARRKEAAALESALNDFIQRLDVIVIDTPGSDGYLSRLGHSMADTLITPMNDSFIDLDLLARVDPDTHEILGPSIYAEMVWDQRKERMLARKRSIDWIVMRNRLGHTQARNKQDIAEILERLKQRIGFRMTDGFGERVIFRELFLKGMTLMDLKEVEGASLNMSHIAARTEVLGLIQAIGLAPPRIGRIPEGQLPLAAAG